VTKLEEVRSELEFWHRHRITLDTVAVGLILFGGLAAFFTSPYFGLTSLPGLALILVTRRKLSAHAVHSEKVSNLKKEITRKFNSRLDSVLDSNVKSLTRLEAIIGFVPDRVEEQLKKDKDLEEIESRKKELEKKISRLKSRTEELPEEIKELKQQREELADRISGAKQGIKEARNTLSDLRDKTNLPDLASLRKN